MKCYECSETIVNGKCSCAEPRPIPAGSKYKTRHDLYYSEIKTTLEIWKMAFVFQFVAWLLLISVIFATR